MKKYEKHREFTKFVGIFTIIENFSIGIFFFEFSCSNVTRGKSAIFGEREEHETRTADLHFLWNFGHYNYGEAHYRIWTTAD